MRTFAALILYKGKMLQKILVTGANGQLGKSLQEIAPQFAEQFSFIWTDVAELDITNKKAICDCLKSNGAQFLINAAAYTAVDKAESDVEKAYLLNETAVQNLAEAASENNAFFVHISTDYVFDGKGTTPYTTDSQPNPISIYGKSKWAGEQAIHHAGGRAAIVRTAWLYSPYGNNFVKTMLRLADTRDAINVVADQIGCPTLARDLARFLMCIIQNNAKIQGVETFHFANQGQISWYDFTCEILRLADKSCPVHPITTQDYPTAAERPNFSVFDLSKSSLFFHYEIPQWQDSLKDVLPQIIYNYENDIR